MIDLSTVLLLLKMVDLSTALLFLSAIVLVLLFSHLQAEDRKQRIREYLRRNGASDITISTQWFDFDKTTTTYDVSYIDREGYHRQTVCKIRTGLFSSNEIYWRDHP